MSDEPTISTDKLQEIELRIQDRSDVGPQNISFSDMTVLVDKLTRKDATGVIFKAVVSSPNLLVNPRLTSEGEIVQLAFRQGIPLQFKGRHIQSIETTTEGLVLDVEGDSVLVTPLPERGELEVSDGDVFQVVLKKWSSKKGRTEVPVINKPSVRGQHWKGGTRNS